MDAFTIERRVQVAQTDFAGIMHFAAFFPLMEECLHEFMRSLDIAMDYRTSGLAWPRVDAHCAYRTPLPYDAPFKVTLHLQKVGASSLTAGFIFSSIRSDIEHAEGALTIVCSHISTDSQNMAPVPIPEVLREKLVRHL